MHQRLVLHLLHCQALVQGGGTSRAAYRWMAVEAEEVECKVEVVRGERQRVLEPYEEGEEVGGYTRSLVQFVGGTAAEDEEGVTCTTGSG